MSIQIYQRPANSFDLQDIDTQEANRAFAHHPDVQGFVDCKIDATATVYRDEAGHIQVSLHLGSTDEELNDLLSGMEWHCETAKGQKTGFDSLEQVAQVLRVPPEQAAWFVTNG